MGMGKYDLKGKYALITGASSGIGKEISRCLAGAGAHCLLHAIPGEREALHEWAGELEQAYAVKTWCLFGDFRSEEAPAALYRAAAGLVPRIDVLVNNAGMMVYGNFHEVPLEKQAALVAVNLSAYMTLLHCALPDMIARGDGRILNISSVSAFQPCPHHAVYGSAKAFVQSLSEAVSQETRGTGVKVTALCPSYTDTPLLKVEGFPPELWWYRISGLSDPAYIARKGVEALRRGKAVFIPGLRNRIIHTLVLRLTPRRLLDAISYFVLRGTSKR
jgi:uncharacterized protein